MKKSLSCFALILLILSACQSDDEIGKHEIEYGNDLVGLASPVKLDFQDARIYLLDYFKNASEIDTVFFAGEMEFIFQADSAIINVQSFSGTESITVLTAVYGGTSYQIPIFRSKKMEYVFSYESENASAKNVSLKGNFNGWNEKASPLTKDDESWTTTLLLNPGLYEYLVVADGREFLDPNNANKKDNGLGGFNSTFNVGLESAAAAAPGKNGTALQGFAGAFG